MYKKADQYQLNMLYEISYPILILTDADVSDSSADDYY